MGGFLSHLKAEQNSEILNASCGPVRGNIYRHGEKTVDGYLGIPFAKPPVGELRFKKPVAAEKWAEPRDCYQYGPGCPQSGAMASVMIPEGFREFQEDNCLTLNVFAPRWKSEEFPKGLPVMVYFYGGGFEIGFSSFFDDYTLTGTLPLKDVILITANYRVGPLGFLTTGDDVSKGNYGLWDQTLALQWVQDNIKSFGGDQGNVTVFGTSAGGASVDLLSLSPHSNKLLHRFIAMSGCGYCDFAVRPKELEAKVFREFAKLHGYAGEDSKSLFEWYKSQSSEKFRETAEFKTPASGFLSFVPNFDGDFFPKPFDQLRKEAPKIDAMATVGEYEGLGFLLWMPDITDFNGVVSRLYGPDVVNNLEEAKRKIFDVYLNGLDSNDKDQIVKKMVELIGDFWFNIAAFDTVRSSAKNGNRTYLASFDYFKKEMSEQSAKKFKLPFHAATHGSELKFILGADLEKFEPNEEELKVMEMMSDFITNFAKYGNPNGKNVSDGWETYKIDEPERYFKIDYPKCEMKDKFQNGRLKVLDEINEKNKKYQEIVYGHRI